MNYYTNSTLNRWSNARSNSRYEWTGGRFDNLTIIGDEPVLYDMSQSAGGNRELVPGMYQIDDRNGDGYITSDDMYYTWPDANPPLQFGLTMSGAWKNLDFSIVFSGAAMKSKSVSLSGYTGFGYLYHLPKNFTSDCYHVTNYGADPWDPQTQWVEGYWPALARVTAAGRAHNATYAAAQPYNNVNASFFRLKSIEVGYRFSPKILQKAKIKSLRVFFNGGNIFTICNPLLKFVDPESNDNGRQGGTFQINRTYNLGVSLNF